VIIISIFYELIQYISFLVGPFIHRELGLLIHVPGATTPAGTRWTTLRDSANNVHLGHLFTDLVLLLLFAALTCWGDAHQKGGMLPLRPGEPLPSVGPMKEQDLASC